MVADTCPISDGNAYLLLLVSMCLWLRFVTYTWFLLRNTSVLISAFDFFLLAERVSLNRWFQVGRYWKLSTWNYIGLSLLSPSIMLCPRSHHLFDIQIAYCFRILYVALPSEALHAPISQPTLLSTCPPSRSILPLPGHDPPPTAPALTLPLRRSVKLCEEPWL